VETCQILVRFAMAFSLPCRHGWWEGFAKVRSEKMHESG
jgi:hypothetical protein